MAATTERSPTPNGKDMEAALHMEKIPSPDSQLTPSHRDYLLSRHGTIDLNPLPSTNPNDPLNWPTWKKNTQLLMVAFHAMMATLMAAGIIPGFVSFAKQYKTSVPQASYLTSVQVNHHCISLSSPIYSFL